MAARPSVLMQAPSFAKGGYSPMTGADFTSSRHAASIVRGPGSRSFSVHPVQGTRVPVLETVGVGVVGQGLDESALANPAAVAGRDHVLEFRLQGVQPGDLQFDIT